MLNVYPVVEKTTNSGFSGLVVTWESELSMLRSLLLKLHENDWPVSGLVGRLAVGKC